MTDPTFPWLTTLVVWPLLGAVVVWLLPAAARRWARHVAVAFSLVELVLAGLALAAFDTGAAGQLQLTEQASWIPAFGVSYALGVTGIGLSLILLSVFLVPLVLLAAWREHPDLTDGEGEGGSRIRTYVALVLVLEAFMVAVFAARDVFLFYVLFEAMLIPVYFMIGLFGGAQRRYAAVKFLIFSLVGGLVMLVGVIALYTQGPGGEEGFLVDSLVGTEMSTWTQRLIFLSFFFAFAIKAPMWPVHTWLPDAAEQAPAGTNVLLVGVLDKVGTFGMLTLCLPLFPEASRWAAPVIIALAVVSILYGAFLAIGQEDLMRLIAYTSVSHFGFIVLGIFAFTSVSIQGSSLYMLTHGLSTGALFLLAGFLVRRWGTARIADYGGLKTVVPVLAGTFLVAGLSALSLPGTAPFVSELLVFVGTFAAHKPAAIVATLGVVLAAIYVLLTYQRIFTGRTREELAPHADLSARERWVVGPLLAAIVVLGLWPAPALDLVREPAAVAQESVGVTDASAEHEVLFGQADAASDDVAATEDGSDK
ncbi:NADH-quinone oxidoreductase subunit M [Actinotalea fermentans]|uniref:NADH-quinone oxidoreductase subunit M n=1 Tax=Actinotalea fermentans TaxID=43671 RepID=A0A511Z0C6_9CELL|nr:NADH-quinone oxidoreductase subunit M [Actinotalea fermentans]KGM16206.1 NADH:ubiquinone oxidoreductase subunit M [Actinotalea fermentans ATCC 43279 = JCM 9966 = DSM 3133]GEN80917.1 NADH-quinone oxidoreductase subunit M [Actinotalea fermentans]